MSVGFIRTNTKSYSSAYRVNEAVYAGEYCTNNPIGKEIIRQTKLDSMIILNKSAKFNLSGE